MNVIKGMDTHIYPSPWTTMQTTSCIVAAAQLGITASIDVNAAIQESNTGNTPFVFKRYILAYSTLKS